MYKSLYEIICAEEYSLTIKNGRKERTSMPTKV